MREYSMVVRTAAISYIFGCLNACELWYVGDKYEELRQGKIVAEDVKAHDKTINVLWYTKSDGRATISVYAVTDPEKQNAILTWIKAVKQRGEVNRAVTVYFYERENMIYWPPHKKGGGWGFSRGPEKLIRTVRL